MDSGKNLLNAKRVSVSRSKGEKGGSPVIFLHKDAVKKALGSDDGRWDLFLRFLLGLSQENNQKLLQKNFGLQERLPQSSQETINYIHEMIRKQSYTDKSINLFHCLNELGDQSLVEQVQKFQSSGDIAKMSPSHWSALAFVLLVSNEDLSIFDLKKYNGSDEVLERLIRVLKASRTALLRDCSLTDRCCKCISPVLGSSSGLEELDLSENHLHDSGMKLLAAGLGSSNCKLQELRLRKCGATEDGCKALFSALHSNPLHLKNLDLSNNILGGEIVLELSKFLKHPECKLQRLWLFRIKLESDHTAVLVSALHSNLSHLKELDLGGNIIGDDGVKEISALLKNPDCKMDALRLFGTKLETNHATVLVSALHSNPSHLKELDLGGNIIGDDGVKEISALLKNPDCKMDALRLEGCRFRESGCAALASSLVSNPAHLRVLNLGRNDLRNSGIEHLSGFLENPLCQLETLNLMCCSLTTVGCQTLIAALSCSSVLKNLDLSYNHLEDQGVRLLSDWLQEPRCRLEVLSLRRCALTTALCQTLIPARSCSFTLNELDVRENDLDDQRLLSDWQQRPECKLKVLRLSTAVVESSNPSYQRKMKNSQPGESGGKLPLLNLQKMEANKLETLMVTEESNNRSQYTA